jgi:hypothetical protein
MNFQPLTRLRFTCTMSTQEILGLLLDTIEMGVGGQSSVHGVTLFP